MADDLQDRLSALFDRVAGTVTVDDALDRVRSVEHPRRRVWLPAVAAAVVLAGVGAVVSTLAVSSIRTRSRSAPSR